MPNRVGPLAAGGGEGNTWPRTVAGRSEKEAWPDEDAYIFKYPRCAPANDSREGCFLLSPLLSRIRDESHASSAPPASFLAFSYFSTLRDCAFLRGDLWSTRGDSERTPALHLRPFKGKREIKVRPRGRRVLETPPPIVRRLFVRY